MGPTLWSVLLGLDLGVLALFLLASAAALLFPSKLNDLPSDPSTLRLALWAQIVFNVVALGLIPFGWVLGTRVKPWAGALLYLRLRWSLRAFAQGLGWGLATLVGLVVLVEVLVKVFHYEPLNPQADSIVGAITLPLAFALALSAGVCEEIFFRGLLQKRLGVWGQAIVFGLFHLSYGTPLQVIVPALLGLFFGYLVRRGASLWVPITAHFVYDFTQLSAPFWEPLLPH